MPNLKPPVTNVTLAHSYRQRIFSALFAGSDFVPLMTLYLTDRTSPEDIRSAMESGFVHAATGTLFQFHQKLNAVQRTEPQFMQGGARSKGAAGELCEDFRLHSRIG